jgi:hypothetical protein
MKSVTKAQTEALVEEIQDRLKGLTDDTVLPKRAEDEWEKIKVKIQRKYELEKEVEEMDEKLDKLREESNEYEKSLDDQITIFQEKNGVVVNWRYLDIEDGETPSVQFPARDFRDKIARQISILSIDKKGNLTAEDIIESITQKLSSKS